MKKNMLSFDTNPYSNKDIFRDIGKKYTFESFNNSKNSDIDFLREGSYKSVRIARTNTHEIEQSMLELKDYIQVLTPSDPQNLESIANKLSFRPKNLPKKSKEEEEYHRKLVEENRISYLESLHKKQLKEMEYKKKIENKLKLQEEISKIFFNDILHNWQEKKKEKKTKEYFYMGLPPNVRGKVWMLCLGNKFSITKEYYQIQVKNIKDTLKKYKKSDKKNEKIIEDNKNLSENNKDNNIDEEKIDESDSEEDSDSTKKILKDKEKSINIIDLDIERTFPFLGVFKGNSPLAEDLREILRVFVISRPDIGYIQGLSFICATLLLNMDKFKAFIALMNLILNPIILPFYKMDNEAIQQRLKLFKQVFYYNMPELCEHFDELGLLPENYFLSWNMTLFTRDVNLELVNRIWDVFMYEGISAIYCAAVVFLSHYEEKMMSMDFVEIMTCIGNIKNVNFDADMFIEAMQNVKIPDWVQKEIAQLQDENIPIY
jgi:hypothetical protein